MDQVTLIELLNDIATGEGQRLQDFSEKEVGLCMCMGIDVGMGIFCVWIDCRLAWLSY